MVVRRLQLQGIPIEQLIAQQTGMSPYGITQAEKMGAPMLVPGLLSAFENMSGPLASGVGGQQAYASGTIRGAFGEVRKDITIGITDALTNPSRTGPLDRATSWLSGLTTAAPGGRSPLSSAIASDGPKVVAYLDSLAKELPPLVRGAEGLVRAAEPLGRMFLAVGQAIIPMVTTLEHDATTLLNSPLVHFLEDVVSKGSKIGPVRTAVVDLFEALLAYKAVATVVGVVKGAQKTIKDLGTMFSTTGKSSAADMMLNAGGLMVEAANTMAGAAGIKGPGIVPAGGGVGGAGAGAGGEGGSIGMAAAAALWGSKGTGLGAEGTIAGGPTGFAMMVTRPLATAAGKKIGSVLGTEPSKADQRQIDSSHVWDLLPGFKHSVWKPVGNDLEHWFGGGGKKKTADEAPVGHTTVTIHAPVTILGNVDKSNVNAVTGQITQAQRNQMDNYFAERDVRGAVPANNR
jgi:hypothetical protein